MEQYICDLCPRDCRALRTAQHGGGVCKMGLLPVVARAAKHMWEEPCISGENGSGTVFFSGCALGCVYCQNVEISQGGVGKQISAPRLREIFFELIEQGTHNINLVNPTHFAESILKALEGGLPVPVVYNTGSYDKVETLRRFDGRVQIYLPDLKYLDSTLAQKYSGAANYSDSAKEAILEMFHQTGPYDIGEDGIMRSGVIIRHLILPENLENTFRVIDWVAETFSPGDVLFSLMSQFTPCGDIKKAPELNRRLNNNEYATALSYLEKSGIEDGFFQELSSAESEYIPEFDLTGV